ncbi:MAG: VapC toxin family PIN domain ribonuclease [Deltaproteobacteria bacterium]|nr:MAG: VapC toxin family PIN domain ribonuclease [Deltaproteobacteria bacterium]
MIFIDTGALLARYFSRDQHHEAATRVWEKIKLKKESCFTSNFILDETFTLLARRAGYVFTAERAHRIYASRYMTILRPTDEDELKALEYFEKFAEHRVSFTDCVSFALMRRHKIRRVFTFDFHFRLAGFICHP